MSSRNGKVKIPDSLYDLHMEIMEDQAPEVWEEYREYGPADLESATRWLRPKLDSTLDQVESALSNGDIEKAEDNIIIFSQLKVRHATAQKHLEMRLIHLGKPPVWGEPEAVPKWLRDGLTEDELAKAVEKQRIRAEFQQRRDEGETAKDIRSDLGDRYGKSDSTIKKIVYQ